MNFSNDFLNNIDDSFNSINTLVVNEMNMLIDVELYENIINYFSIQNIVVDLDLTKD